MLTCSASGTKSATPIPAIVFKTLDTHVGIANPTIDDIEVIDKESRVNARLAIRKLN